jgi:hypothetical protein
MAEPDTNRMAPDGIDPLDIDPLDWTVDQVVAYLCYGPSTAVGPSRRPDPVVFGPVLRENLIDGVVLLTDMNNETLCTDLKLQAYGHRSWVLATIKYLRNLSFKYRTTVEDDKLLGENAGKLLSFIPYSKH